MLSPEEWTILGVSLGIAVRALAFSLPLAIATAWVLARTHSPARSALDAIVHLPLVLPPVLVGFLMLLTLGRRSPIGSWLENTFGITLAFTAEGAALATAVMTFPILVRAIRIAFELIDPELLQAAASLGAGPWDRFVTLVLPMAAPAILAGSVTAFAAGLGEFGAVITFAANVPGETRTLPLAIYAALNTAGGEETALRLGAISFAAAMIGLIAAELLQRWAKTRMSTA